MKTLFVIIAYVFVGAITHGVFGQIKSDFSIHSLGYENGMLVFEIENRKDTVVSVIISSVFRKNGVDVISEYLIRNDTIIVEFHSYPNVLSSHGKVDYIIDGDYYLQRNIKSGNFLRLMVKIKKRKYRKLSTIGVYFPITDLYFFRRFK